MKKIKSSPMPKDKKIKSSFDKTKSAKKGKKGNLPSNPKRGDVVFLGDFEKVPNAEMSSAGPESSAENVKAAVSYFKSNMKKVAKKIEDEIDERMHSEFKKFKSLSQIVLPREFVIGERGQEIFRLANVLSDTKSMNGLVEQLKKTLEKKLKETHFNFKDTIENSDKITYKLASIKVDADSIRFDFEPSTIENKPKEVTENYTPKSELKELIEREYETLRTSNLEKKEKQKDFDDFLKNQY